MIELRPCPFCGGRAELNEHTGYGWRTVQCVECCASTSEAGVYTAAEAAARWNRRAADQPDAAIPCSSCGQPAAAHAVQNGGYVCPPNQPAAALECAHDGKCTFWETAAMSGILCHVCGKHFDVHTYSAADNSTGKPQIDR